MIPHAAAIWTAAPPDWLWPKLDKLLQRHGSGGVFFRADDIGRVDPAFVRMIDVFRRRRVALGLAVVPAWVRDGGTLLTRCCMPDDPLWQWQMHGTAHVNHAISGKKSEWCAERSREDKRAALLWGREVMQRVLHARPDTFTPPWNRCDAETMHLLPELGFTTLSRDTDPQPPTIPRLTARDVRVDLHTRKETDPALGWERLLGEFETGLERGDCGVMLHHARMNEAGLTFLEALLERVQRPPAAS